MTQQQWFIEYDLWARSVLQLFAKAYREDDAEAAIFYGNWFYAINQNLGMAERPNFEAWKKAQAV
jgi:hypothetical protein